MTRPLVLSAMLLGALLAASCSEGGDASPVASGGDGGSSGSAGGGSGGGGGGAGGSPAEPPFCGQSGISKGPWALSVDGSSAVVRWETCVEAPSRLTYQPEDGNGVEQATEGTSSSHEILIETKSLVAARGADLAGVWRMHEVKLSGLQPSTCYRYQAAGEATGRFCTARASGEPLRFSFLADTNPGLDTEGVAKVLARLEQTRPDFTLHGGDMQYYSSGLEPYAWWFGAMAPLLRAGALWPAVGNHESEKDTEFEDYYARFWGGAGFHPQHNAYRFESAGVHFFSLDTEDDLKPGSAQVAWLEAELAAAQQSPGFRFAVVFMHRPLVTCGDTGELVTEREGLWPIFAQRGVKLVLAGHMHGYERFEMDGMTLLVSGGGGGLAGDVQVNAQRPLCGQRKASGVYTHAVHFTLDGTTLSATTVDAAGQERDSFSLAVP